MHPTKWMSGFTVLTLLAGCAASTDDDAAGGDESAVIEGGKVESLFVPLSDLESSTTHTAKVAMVKLRGVDERVQVKRCHQYWRRDQDAQQAIVCRDGNIEIIMEGKSGTDFTRWARVRFASGGEPQFFT